MLYVLYLLSVCLFAQDARSIVVRSVNVTNLDPALEREYTYRVRSEEREPDRSGGLRVKESTVREVLYLGGKRFAHELERNGKPLPENEARKQHAKLDKAAAEANRLTPAERAKRDAQTEKERAEDRQRLKLIAEAYDFTLKGEPVINGRRTWQIEGTPRGAYRGKHDGLFKKLKGTLWIDQQDYHWVRVEAEALDTISFGLFLARIAPGTRVMFELARINDEVWLPKRIEIAGSARVALVKKQSVDQVITFSDFRRYRTESRITQVADGQPQ